MTTFEERQALIAGHREGYAGPGTSFYELNVIRRLFDLDDAADRQPEPVPHKYPRQLDIYIAEIPF